MSTTLSQRLRDLRDVLMSEESDTPNVMNLVDDCIAQAEAQEAQAIGEQTPVAWMGIGTIKECSDGWVALCNPKTLAGLTDEGKAKYPIPLYRSPISPEERDRAIEAAEYLRDYSRTTSPELVTKYAEDILSALRLS